MSEEVKDLVFFQSIVIFLSIGSGVFVFLFFLFQKQSKELRKLKWLILFFLFSGFFIDFILLIIPQTVKLNIFFFNVFSFLTAVFITLIFNEIIVTTRFKLLSKILFGIYIGVITSFFLMRGSVSINNSVMQTVLSFIILFFVLYYFFWKFNSVGTIPITKESTFWFFTALLIYFGIPLVLTISRKYIGNVQPIAFGYLWQVMNFSTVLFHLLIAKMLWLMKTE